jgi:hypothetical protein
LKKNPIFLIGGIALLIGLANIPYGYYQFLRWFVCGIAVYGAYLNYSNKRYIWVWVFGVVALLFNPIFKFYLASGAWKTIYLSSGVLFCIYFGIKK